MIINSKATQIRPDLWENPLKFQPSRFLTDLKHPCAFILFGAGGRICAGMRIAYMETKIALIHLLKKFHFEYVGKEPLEFVYGIAMPTKWDLMFRVSERKS
jgi:cytochrome P450